MKLIIAIILLMTAVNGRAQNLVGTQWEIKEYYAAFDDIPAERVVYYTTEEDVDYSLNLEGLVYDFKTDKVDMFYISDPDQEGSQQATYTGDDQVVINDVVYSIEEISEDHLKLVNVSYYIQTETENALPIRTVLEFRKHASQVVTQIAGEQAGFRILPNPVKDRVYFGSFVRRVGVFDLNGRLVLSTPVEGTSTDLGGLPEGYYLIKVETYQGTRHTRIIKE